VINCKLHKKKSANLTVIEFQDAEMATYRLVQEAEFPKGANIIIGKNS
jgi:hypothetical protein